jgi:hypothetical protein
MSLSLQCLSLWCCYVDIKRSLLILPWIASVDIRVTVPPDPFKGLIFFARQRLSLILLRVPLNRCSSYKQGMRPRFHTRCLVLTLSLSWLGGWFQAGVVGISYEMQVFTVHRHLWYKGRLSAVSMGFVGWKYKVLSRLGRLPMLEMLPILDKLLLDHLERLEYRVAVFQCKHLITWLEITSLTNGTCDASFVFGIIITCPIN